MKMFPTFGITVVLVSMFGFTAFAGEARYEGVVAIRTPSLWKDLVVTARPFGLDRATEIKVNGVVAVTKTEPCGRDCDDGRPLEWACTTNFSVDGKGGPLVRIEARDGDTGKFYNADAAPYSMHLTQSMTITQKVSNSVIKTCEVPTDLTSTIRTKLASAASFSSTSSSFFVNERCGAYLYVNEFEMPTPAVERNSESSYSVRFNERELPAELGLRAYVWCDGEHFEIFQKLSLAR